MSGHTEGSEDEFTNEWSERVFSEVVEINNYPSLEKGEAQTYVAMENLKPNTREVQDTSQKEYKYSAPRFKNGDTLFPKMSRCLELGKTAYVDVLDEDEVAFGSTEFIVMRPKSKEILPKYIYYTLRREEIRQHALSWATGSTARRQRISTDFFDNLSIKIPPKETQSKIVDFLDAIDTKLRKNKNMNNILEEIARTLYRYWFIEFTPYKDFKQTEIGNIPEGFEVKTIGEVSEINPSTINDNFRHEVIEYVDISSTGRGFVENTDKYSLDDAPSRANRTVADGDTIISTVRPGREQYAYINNPAENLVVSTGFVVLRPIKDSVLNDISLYYATTTSNVIRYFENNASGSAYPSVNVNLIKDTKLPVPPKNDVEEFSSTVKSFRELISKNDSEHETLSHIRDILLPKLLRGEINIHNSSC